MRARSCAGSGALIARSAASSALPRLGGAALRDPADDLAGERRADLGPFAGLDGSPSISSGWSVLTAVMEVNSNRSPVSFRRAARIGGPVAVGARVDRHDRERRCPDVARPRLLLVRARHGRVLGDRRAAPNFAPRDRVVAVRRGAVHLRPAARLRGRTALPRARGAADQGRGGDLRHADPDGLAAGAPLARRRPPALVGLRDVVHLPDALLRDADRRGRPLDGGRTTGSSATRRWSACSR